MEVKVAARNKSILSKGSAGFSPGLGIGSGVLRPGLEKGSEGEDEVANGSSALRAIPLCPHARLKRKGAPAKS